MQGVQDAAVFTVQRPKSGVACAKKLKEKNQIYISIPVRYDVGLVDRRAPLRVPHLFAEHYHRLTLNACKADAVPEQLQPVCTRYPQ